MVELKNTLYLLCILALLYNGTHRNKCFVEGSSIGNTSLTTEEKHSLKKIEVKHILGHITDLSVGHIAGFIGKGSDEIMDDKRFRFYFFEFHDVNGDSLLDGLELVKSVIHFYDELSTFDPANKVDAYPDEILSKTVDNLLEVHDSNNDGFLDYLEFTVDAPLEF